MVLQKQASISYPQPALRWPGGKYFARKFLLTQFPSDVNEYREPMIGGGSVFLAAHAAGIANSYWINDIQDLLFSFWVCAQDRSQNAELRSRLFRFIEKRKTVEQARMLFEYMKSQKANQSVLAKAVRLFILNRCSFSGTTTEGGFSADCAFNRFNISAVKRIEHLQPALAVSKISCLSYEHLMDMRKKDFIFLDPPYSETKNLYDCEDFDYLRFSELLRNVSGRFMVTINDCEQTRELFSWANVTPWSLQYGMNNCGADKKSKRGNELLVTNYALPKP